MNCELSTRLQLPGTPTGTGVDGVVVVGVVAVGVVVVVVATVAVRVGMVVVGGGLADVRGGLVVVPVVVVPVEVWVDAGGRIRQITASLTPAGASTPALAVTIDLDDFGAPVSIAAPPAAETYLTTLAALATSTGLSGTQI